MRRVGKDLALYPCGVKNWKVGGVFSSGPLAHRCIVLACYVQHYVLVYPRLELCDLWWQEAGTGCVGGGGGGHGASARDLMDNNVPLTMSMRLWSSSRSSGMEKEQRLLLPLAAFRSTGRSFLRIEFRVFLISFSAFFASLRRSGTNDVISLLSAFIWRRGRRRGLKSQS